MKLFVITMLLLASGTMLLGQYGRLDADRNDKTDRRGKDDVKGEDPETIHERSRDVLDAARNLEDTANRLRKRKADVRQIKRDIEQLYLQLYRLDQSIPGKRIVPPPFKKVKLPPIIDFGTSEAKDGGAVILHPKNNDYRPTAKINITNTGGHSRYLRITEIEITTPENEVVKVSALLKRNMYDKLYSGRNYSYTFLNPVKIKAIKISISHETNGLKVWTVPVGKIVPPVQPIPLR